MKVEYEEKQPLREKNMHYFLILWDAHKMRRTRLVLVKARPRKTHFMNIEDTFCYHGMRNEGPTGPLKRSRR